MFYSQYVLTKKGPLAKIWLAAHMQSKLTKAMVFATDVRKAVDKIMSPDAPMALRLTSNLLLGVARILSRKAKYLLQESSEALTKMKLTFKLGSSTALDLPAKQNNAAYNAITLDDAQAAPLLDLDLLPRRPDHSHTSSYLAAERDITIDEFAGGLSAGISDAFALEPELARADEEELALAQDEPLLFTPSQRTPLRSSQSSAIASVLSAPMRESLGSVELVRGEDRESPSLPQTPRLTGDTPEALRADMPFEMRDAATPQLDDEPREDRGEEQDDDPLAPPPLDEPMEDAPREERMSVDAGAVTRTPPRSEMARLSTGGEELELADDGTPRPAPRLDAPTPQPTQELPTQRVPGRGRKRRALARVDDEKTEMTAAEFRACLNDTSDLIRRPRARRRITASDPDAMRSDHHVLARPAVAMPAEMASLYVEWFSADAMMHRVSSPLSEGEREQRDKSADRSAVVSEPSAVPSASQRSDADSSAIPPPPPLEFLPPQLELLEPDHPVPETPGQPVPRTPSPVDTPHTPAAGFPETPGGGIPETPGPGFPQTPGPDAPQSMKLLQVSQTRVEVNAADENESDTLSKRALKMRNLIADSLVDGKFNLSENLRQESGVTRRVAARSFYELLNLCSRKLISLEQDAPYADVIATPVSGAFESV